MKKWAAGLLVTAVLLTAGGCQSEGFSIEQVRAQYAQTVDIDGQADITINSGVMVDYTVTYQRHGGVSTVTIVNPVSLAGISATTAQGKAEITYEDIAVETLLPAVPGFSPVDALAGVTDDLAGGVPIDSCVETLEDTSCIALTFSVPAGEYEGEKRVWLDAETLALRRAEFYLDGQMVMALTMIEMTFSETQSTPDGQEG